MADKTPRVVHLTSVHARYDNRILVKECASLAKSGFETYLIVADGKGDELYKEVKIIDVGKKRGFFDRLTRIGLKIYKQAKRLDADIYHFHDPELLFVAYLLRNDKNKVIYDVHEDYRTSIGQKKYLNGFLKRLFTEVYVFLEKRAATRFTIILAEKYYLTYLPKGFLILNYPVVEQSDVNYKATDNLDAENGIQLLYTGNVTEVRGAFTQSVLVDKINDIHISFVGYCPSNTAKQVLATVEQKDKIKFIGIDEYVPQTTIKQVYQNRNWLAGIAIFPKTKHYEKKELTKFFEYMLNGLPIICTDFPAWQKFIEDNQCGIAVNPNDYYEIEKAINYLVLNPEQRTIMIANGRRRVLEELNWSSQEKVLLDIYHSLVQKRMKPRFN